MKPIPKVFIFFLALALTGLHSASAQSSEGDWVQENWQRVSGEVDNFQNQFPGRQPDNHPRVAKNDFRSGRQTFQSGVQQADHQQAIPDRVGSLPDAGMRSLDSANASPDESAGDGWASEKGEQSWTQGLQSQLSGIDVGKVVSSLAIVLGGYFGFVWLLRRMNPKMNSGLPSEVFELIGTSRMNTKQTLQLVRLGSKLLLLVHGDEGTQPIAEITDTDEVEYLTSLCNQRPRPEPRRATRTSSPSSSTSATVFRRALDRAKTEGSSTEAAMDQVIRKLSELAGKSSSRTDYEA